MVISLTQAESCVLFADQALFSILERKYQMKMIVLGKLLLLLLPQKCTRNQLLLLHVFNRIKDLRELLFYKQMLQLPFWNGAKVSCAHSTTVPRAS